jgi:hypothetical protein
MVFSPWVSIGDRRSILSVVFAIAQTQTLASGVQRCKPCDSAGHSNALAWRVNKNKNDSDGRFIDEAGPGRYNHQQHTHGAPFQRCISPRSALSIKCTTMMNQLRRDGTQRSPHQRSITRKTVHRRAAPMRWNVVARPGVPPGRTDCMPAVDRRKIEMYRRPGPLKSRAALSTMSRGTLCI